MTNKVFGYCRVSTQDQNLDLQRDALRQAGCDVIYEEKASGAQNDRPELQALLKAVREGDKVIVWKLDRLARSVKQLIEAVLAGSWRGVCERTREHRYLLARRSIDLSHFWRFGSI